MTVLVFGGSGQVGQALARQRDDVVALGRDEADVTVGRAVWGALGRVRPRAVVNAAAFTDVDGAERARRVAWAVNARGAGEVAAACRAFDVPLVHLSTDYVFAGRSGGALVPSDAVDPLGVYAESKAAGEQAVRQRGGQVAIVRTAWVLSAQRRGFCHAVLERARRMGHVRVIADVWGNPTPADLVARAVGALLDDGAADVWTTWHVAGQPATTWHGLATQALSDAKVRAPVGAIGADAWPAQAPRPRDSRMDGSAFEARFDVPLDWRPGVRAMMAAIA